MAVTSSKRPKGIVIVGPTASGKTALAIDIAKQIDGEIICADSRTVYEGMNVATAKPSSDEQRGVPHWGIDLAKPSDRFTVAEFQQYAKQHIQAIRRRGRVPILVGGTGLYIDSVVFDYTFPDVSAADSGENFEVSSVPELQNYCLENNISLPENKDNKRHLISAILRNGVIPKRRDTPLEGVSIYGIAVDKATISSRIESRWRHMIEDGVIGEAESLRSEYGENLESMTANAYQLIFEHLDGKIDAAQLSEMFTTRDRQLAKRQMTWFRRNPFISWGTSEDVYRSINSLFTSE